jgi:hypothetical protein
MNGENEEQLQVEWKFDAAFRVPVKRTAPTARRLPQEFIEPFFYSPEEVAWESSVFWA